MKWWRIIKQKLSRRDKTLYKIIQDIAAATGSDDTTVLQTLLEEGIKAYYKDNEEIEKAIKLRRKALGKTVVKTDFDTMLDTMGKFVEKIGAIVDIVNNMTSKLSARMLTSQIRESVNLISSLKRELGEPMQPEQESALQKEIGELIIRSLLRGLGLPGLPSHPATNKESKTIIGKGPVIQLKELPEEEEEETSK